MVTLYLMHFTDKLFNLKFKENNQSISNKINKYFVVNIIENIMSILYCYSNIDID